ncbi:WXG100 family type VII secretion target [Streptomyces sp. LamerLS-316]|uniref:WXG100 family type VII secretion target n=3 Tax=Streptomyces TaxID=1883 RepID=A0AAU1LYN3_9ACTN|nr:MULTISPECIES: WXG100 family type VII secretion target [Streptomyces]WSS64576.1 WXG100 family type VII secretion target [Streptomyces sp. NBC_01177]WSS71570.1 WXG100 family type VII secretion target [Streptomyces sp. NBC_01175]WSS78579.1 WXG100 family type VII secretion target [Streptomyces sp. NBC_01174]MBL1291796.1 WXG100 family type VII secretion target [Streptomyces silvae]MDX3057952.1 WXG100 family type VII secretion target [Streptomyces sp. NE06-03E]
MADQKLSDEMLLKLEGELTKRFDSVRGQLKTLQATIDSLEGAWKGIGASAFNVKQADINVKMGNIATRLVNFQEAIKAARTISGNTEDEIRQALQGVDVVPGHSGGSEAKTSAINAL